MRNRRTTRLSLLQLGLASLSLLGLMAILASTSQGGDNGSLPVMIGSCFEPAFAAQMTVDDFERDMRLADDRGGCKQGCEAYNRLCLDMTREHEKCSKVAIKNDWKIETVACTGLDTRKQRKRCRKAVTADRNLALSGVSQGAEQGVIFCKQFFKVACPQTYCAKRSSSPSPGPF